MLLRFMSSTMWKRPADIELRLNERPRMAGPFAVNPVTSPRESLANVATPTMLPPNASLNSGCNAIADLVGDLDRQAPSRATTV